MTIDPALIRAEGSDIQRIEVAPKRAAEIAREVEGLFEGLGRVAPMIGFLDDPEDFRAVLWELRETRFEMPRER